MQQFGGWKGAVTEPKGVSNYALNEEAQKPLHFDVGIMCVCLSFLKGMLATPDYKVGIFGGGSPNWTWIFSHYGTANHARDPCRSRFLGLTVLTVSLSTHYTRG